MQKLAKIRIRLNRLYRESSIRQVAYDAHINALTLYRIRDGKTIKTETAEKLYDYLESKNVTQ